MIGGVLGSYRVVRELGRGGMGVVYTAEHTKIGKRAVVHVRVVGHDAEQYIVAWWKHIKPVTTGPE